MGDHCFELNLCTRPSMIRPNQNGVTYAKLNNQLKLLKNIQIPKQNNFS
jgi:hypothetical protein